MRESRSFVGTRSQRHQILHLRYFVHLLRPLTPETSYYFRVTNTTDNIVSDPLEIKTNESKFKDLPATANPGDIILYQDFHEFLWGGDLLNNAAGYSNDARSSATSIEKATGVNPVSADKFYLASADTEMGLFNTLGKAIPSTSLKDWGQQQSESGNADKPASCWPVPVC